MRRVPDKLRKGARAVAVLLLVGGMVAVGAEAQTVPPSVGDDCPTRWRRHASSDSAVTLCLPAGFVRREEHTWMRPSRVKGAPPIDFFSVEVLAWPADSASVAPWPPTLAPEPGCQFDCIAVDSATKHADAWDGVTARTEIGLASGGVAGLRRRPVMVSGWVISNERRGFAQGWAAKAVTLDTLRRALRTVQVRP